MPMLPLTIFKHSLVTEEIGNDIVAYTVMDKSCYFVRNDIPHPMKYTSDY